MENEYAVGPNGWIQFLDERKDGFVFTLKPGSSWVFRDEFGNRHEITFWAKKGNRIRLRISKPEEKD